MLYVHVRVSARGLLGSVFVKAACGEQDQFLSRLLVVSKT